jgi:hypothetical protein
VPVKLPLKMRGRRVAAGIGNLAHGLVRLHLGDGASSMAVRMESVSLMKWVAVGEMGLSV